MRNMFCTLDPEAWPLAGKERERELQLSDLERERLEDMLRQLRIERSDIQTAMLFALDHANCAAEISECLVSSLTLLETPLHLKVSRCESQQRQKLRSAMLLNRAQP